TMRSTPDYLFTWLASAYAGTILVTANPRSADAELAGLIGQVRPRLVVSDAAVEGAVGVERLFEHEAAFDGTGPARPADAAVLIPTSGTTGRSKLVTQTHRAYVMAGVGFPWWMELGPDDRLMTSLPLFHINAPTYSMLGSVGAHASLALLPAFSASTFLDSARRHGATEFNAIGAMLEILMRQPERPDDADTPLRLCYTGPAPPASCARRGQRGEGHRPGRRGPSSRRDRRVVAAQPGDHARVLGHAGRDGRGDHRRRLAAHRRPGDPG